MNQRRLRCNAALGLIAGTRQGNRKGLAALRAEGEPGVESGQPPKVLKEERGGDE